MILIGAQPRGQCDAAPRSWGYSPVTAYCRDFGTWKPTPRVMFTPHLNTAAMATDSLGCKKEGNKKEVHVCPICEDTIKEKTGRRPGDDAVMCDGECASWVHRRCAGLSVNAFELVCNSRD